MTPEQVIAMKGKYMEYKNCPNCENIGWYVDVNPYTGEPDQTQCEFCYREEKSIFNVIEQLQAENAGLKNDIENLAFRILASGHPSDISGVYMAARAFQSLARGETDNAKEYEAQAKKEMANVNKIKADAVRKATKELRVAQTKGGDKWLCRVVDLNDYANKLEGKE